MCKGYMIACSLTYEISSADSGQSFRYHTVKGKKNNALYQTMDFINIQNMSIIIYEILKQVPRVTDDTSYSYKLAKIYYLWLL